MYNVNAKVFVVVIYRCFCVPWSAVDSGKSGSAARCQLTFVRFGRAAVVAGCLLGGGWRGWGGNGRRQLTNRWVW